MLFGETTDACCENHTENTNTLHRQNAEFLYVKGGGTYRSTGLERDKEKY
jgi:hypothetical protein